jgi:hypothetical protein
MKQLFFILVVIILFSCSKETINIDNSYLISNNNDFKYLFNYKYNYMKGRDSLINIKLLNRLNSERKNIIKYVNDLKIKEDYISITEKYYYYKEKKDFILCELSLIFPSDNSFSIVKTYKKNNDSFIFQDNIIVMSDDLDILLKNKYKHNKYNSNDYNEYNSVYIENLINNNEVINIEFNLFFTEDRKIPAPQSASSAKCPLLRKVSSSAKCPHFAVNKRRNNQ